MTLALFLHTPTDARYIVLLVDGIVQHAAGPLDNAQLAAIQRDEWRTPWQVGLGAWVEARRGEFTQVWPQGAGGGDAPRAGSPPARTGDNQRRTATE